MTGPRLTRRLVLEEKVQTADGAGGFVETWHALGTLWGDVRSRGGGEGEVDHLRQSKTALTVSIRSAAFGAPSRPKPGQRFTEGARVFDIHAVVERDPSARFLDCLCTEEVLT